MKSNRRRGLYWIQRTIVVSKQRKSTHMEERRSYGEKMIEKLVKLQVGVMMWWLPVKAILESLQK